MSLITRNNYEAYLLDYYEENLSPALIAELMLFLENNPELKEDLDDFELLVLQPNETKLSTKETLKIEEGTFTPINYENFIIAEIEGENTPEQSAALIAFLGVNPDKKETFLAYQQTKLIAPTLIFNDKPSLKRENKVIPLYWWYTSAAAVILVLFLLQGINWDNQQKDNPIVEKAEQVIPIENKEQNSTKVIEENVVEEPINIADKQSKKQIIPANFKKKPEHKKSTINPIEKENLTANQLANSDRLPIKDTLTNKVKDDIEVVEEEILYADNVVITYEDESVIVQSEPLSKIDLIKAVVNQRVKDKFLQPKNNNEQVETYAINIGMLGFWKNKKKKEN